MDAGIERVCALIDQIVASLKAWGEERTFAEAFGWNTAPITKHDLAELFADIAVRLRVKGTNPISAEFAAEIPKMEARLRVFQGQNLPQLLGGNSTGAIAPVTMLLDWLKLHVESSFDWEAVPPDALPLKIRRRLRAVNASLDGIEPDVASLSAQIAEIKEAHETALALPADLQTLQEANEKIAEVSTESAAALSEISQKNTDATAALEAMETTRREAEKIIGQVQQAYSAATSRGLAAAFDERASRLSTSMWICIGGLVIALASGSYIGATRVAALSVALANKEGLGEIISELLISILSVGAPLWFAWLMTKQIGQRFRLAEDYAYKASVAKAYEGFRREAVRIDPLFEARLFASALTRLEEAPLRLMEMESHGSPFQELFASENFRRAMDAVPELKADFITLAKGTLDKMKFGKSPPAEAVEPPQAPKA